MRKTKLILSWVGIVGLWIAYVFWLTMGLPSDINHLVHIGFVIGFIFSLYFISVVATTAGEKIPDDKKIEEVVEEKECQVFEISEYRTYKIKDADLKLKQC